MTMSPVMEAVERAVGSLNVDELRRHVHDV
jgi:hypothetical protein